mmetsp:Transcript_8286/g.20920  ORF Transcript_8286/g.20920 Transcript_8286/m.20920 type:complete len:548 (+) Transcript_8286:1063-2706(+)
MTLLGLPTSDGRRWSHVDVVRDSAVDGYVTGAEEEAGPSRFLWGTPAKTTKWRSHASHVDSTGSDVLCMLLAGSEKEARRHALLGRSFAGVGGRQSRARHVDVDAGGASHVALAGTTETASCPLSLKGALANAGRRRSLRHGGHADAVRGGAFDEQVGGAGRGGGGAFHGGHPSGAAEGEARRSTMHLVLSEGVGGHWSPSGHVGMVCGGVHEQLALWRHVARGERRRGLAGSFVARIGVLGMQLAGAEGKSRHSSLLGRRGSASVGVLGKQLASSKKGTWIALLFHAFFPCVGGLRSQPKRVDAARSDAIQRHTTSADEENRRSLRRARPASAGRRRRGRAGHVDAVRGRAPGGRSAGAEEKARRAEGGGRCGKLHWTLAGAAETTWRSTMHVGLPTSVGRCWSRAGHVNMVRGGALSEQVASARGTNWRSSKLGEPILRGGWHGSQSVYVVACGGVLDGQRASAAGRAGRSAPLGRMRASQWRRRRRASSAVGVLIGAGRPERRLAGAGRTGCRAGRNWCRAGTNRCRAGRKWCFMPLRRPAEGA